ncbi:MAG: hypothetical protein JXA14_22835 [Anaerolineae bacterium]|nr:hypothetical protein [Anaerolineae bacterium]
MGLIDRITNRLAQFLPQRKRSTGQEIADAEAARRMRGAARTVETFRRTQEQLDRRETIELCRRMYEKDTRAKGVIRTLAGDVVKHGVQVQVTGGPDARRAQELANDLIDRLGLAKRLDDWLRLTLREGDSFLEVSVDEDDLVSDVTRKPTLGMHRNSNRADRFDDPARAFWYSDSVFSVYGEAPKDALWFAQWQIVHARWDHDEGNRYGSPLFESATGPWKRMTEGEIDVAIRRKTRAGMKYLHSLEDADKTDIEAYMERNKTALDNPFAAVADFFTNKKATITTVQGDANLSQIEDVLHHIRTWWVASPVPMSLVGYGQDLNRDVLDKQKEQYDEALPAVQDWLADQILVPLIKLQWMLQGIWPDSYSYQVIWPKKKVISPAMMKDLGDALNRLIATGFFPDEVIVSLIAEALPGVDTELIADHIQKQRANQAEDRIAASGQETLRRLRGQTPPEREQADQAQDDEEAEANERRKRARR